MDNLRRHTTGDMNKLGKVLQDKISTLRKQDAEEVIEAFNTAACSVGFFNCIYDDKEQDFNDLSYMLEIINIEFYE